MKKIILIGAMALGVYAAPAQALVNVSFSGGSTSQPSGTQVIQDFEGYSTGALIGTNAKTYNSSVSGQSARPAFDSTGNFGVVLTNGSYTINFKPTDVLSFIIGSVDTYNTLNLQFSDGTSKDYFGGQIINDFAFDSGNQQSNETNGRVTYTADSGTHIVGATFKSQGNSFEFDNIAVGISAVPEPATWGMMIVGFGAIGAGMRRKRRVQKLSLA